MSRRIVPYAAAMAALVSLAGAVEPEPGFRAPSVPPRAQYTMNARFTQEDSQGTLTLKEVIRFANDTARPLTRLALTVPTGDAHSLEIQVDGEPVTLEPTSSRSLGLLTLPSRLNPADTVEIRIAFSRELPIDGETMQLTFEDWYPRLWWGFPTHDDYDVGIETPPIWAVGTSGLRDPQTGRYIISGAKDFGLFLGRGYKTLEAEAGGVHIRAIHAPAAEKCAQLLLETAVDVVGFYRERFGLYPYPNLTIVPGADRPMGGYPVAAALAAIHGQRQMDEEADLHWRWITAHEIGHQYWGEYVLERDSPGWLWIGLGIYADREYVRARGLALDKHQALVDCYLQGVAQGLDTTLTLSQQQYEAVDFDYNNVCIHGKGFSVISALANVLGRETFNSAYVRCLLEFAGKRLGAADFQRVCEEESGEDLSWFFDQWVRSNRYLVYSAGEETCAKRGNRYVSQVQVTRAGTLEMPVPVAAYFKDGTVQVKRTDRLLDVNTLTFESTAPLERVQIDPECELTMATAPAAAGREVGEAVRNLGWTGTGPQARDLFPQAKEEDLKDADVWAKLGMCLYDGAHYEESLEAFERAGQLARKGDSWYFPAMVWQGHLLDLLGPREEAVRRLRCDTPAAIRLAVG